MSHVKPSNVPLAGAFGQDVDPHSIKEKTYMRGIYEDYHAHQLQCENEKERAEEGIAVNLAAVQQKVAVDKPVDEGEGVIEVLREVLDKEQPELGVDNHRLGMVVGEEPDGGRQQKDELPENPEDMTLQARGVEGVLEDVRLGDLVFCACEYLERLHYTELTLMLPP